MFFLDENIPKSLVETIKKLGFEAEHARDVGLGGCSDIKIAEYAKKRNAILITKDLEFGSLIIYSKNSHYGLIVIRLPHFYTSNQIVKIMNRFLSNINVEILINSIVILEIARYRIRKLI